LEADDVMASKGKIGDQWEALAFVATSTSGCVYGRIGRIEAGDDVRVGSK
jgi:hypothetical protein